MCRRRPRHFAGCLNDCVKRKVGATSNRWRANSHKVYCPLVGELSDILASRNNYLPPATTYSRHCYNKAVQKLTHFINSPARSYAPMHGSKNLIWEVFLCDEPKKGIWDVPVKNRGLWFSLLRLFRRASEISVARHLLCNKPPSDGGHLGQVPPHQLRICRPPLLLQSHRGGIGAWLGYNAKAVLNLETGFAWALGTRIPETWCRTVRAFEDTMSLHKV